MQLCLAAGPIDWRHHRHRSERIPVGADRIVNVGWSDRRPAEREVVSDSIHSHMKRKRERREESFIPSSVAEKAASPLPRTTDWQEVKLAGWRELSGGSRQRAEGVDGSDPTYLLPFCGSVRDRASNFLYTWLLLRPLLLHHSSTTVPRCDSQHYHCMERSTDFSILLDLITFKRSFLHLIVISTLGLNFLTIKTLPYT